MDILKLNKIVILGIIICFLSCKKNHKKPKGYCDKYISGGMLINLKISNTITDSEFESINIKSKNKGDLVFLEKKAEHRRLIINDTLLLTDTLFLNFKDETYKLHSFKNGDLEITPGEGGDNYENCFLHEMYLNNDLIKKEWNITFKITLPNKPDKVQE